MKPAPCPIYHATIPANAPGGFCPACLLRDAEEPAPAGNDTLSLEEIAAAFLQFEILKLIGQGGMGFVYQVRQPNPDRTVALKTFFPNSAAIRHSPAASPARHVCWESGIIRTSSPFTNTVSRIC